MGSTKIRTFSAAAILVVLVTGPALSQQTSHMTINSELEQYLRFAQTITATDPMPWSIRGFSKTQEKKLMTIPGTHPWQSVLDETGRHQRNGIEILPVSFAAIANSAYPFGNNDGPVWAGRGLTTAIEGGIAGTFGPLSITIAPHFFRAENASFALMNNAQTGKLRFADGQFPDIVDRPQRFGSGAYQQLSPGQSTIRLDGLGATLGISSANQSWGPSERHQFILGNNAAGYPHLFVGTEQPADLWIAKVQARAVWGMLEQSSFSSVGGPQYFIDGVQSGRRRFTAGIIATIEPRGVSGLELGAARFFHRAWPKEGLSAGDFTALFQNVFKRGLPTEVSLPGSENTKGVRDNQLFSLFARWVVPGTGFEAYGEFGREDHSWDIRDFVLEPDHGGSSRLLGVRKMWMNGYALRAEAINYEAPQLTRFRPEGAVYVHYVLRQGHTFKGQPLGADAGLGSGAGSVVAVDRYAASGRTSIVWRRSVAHSQGRFYLTDIETDEAPDILQNLSVETVRFRGALQLSLSGGLTMNFNRNFGSDVFNLGLKVGTAYKF